MAGRRDEISSSRNVFAAGLMQANESLPITMGVSPASGRSAPSASRVRPGGCGSRPVGPRDSYLLRRAYELLFGDTPVAFACSMTRKPFSWAFATKPDTQSVGE